MLSAPSVAELAAFTGRDEASFSAFADAALEQATLLFTAKSGLTAYPDDPDQAQIAKYAIMQMADQIYLSQPYTQTSASPFQSETIGSYSYSKGNNSSTKTGGGTGLYWWDLALDLLATAQKAGISSSGVQVFTEEIATTVDGQRYVPSVTDQIEPEYVYWPGG